MHWYLNTFLISNNSAALCILWEPSTSLWRRRWHPTPVLLPGESHRRRNLVGCSPWGRWGSDTTERLHSHFLLSCIGEGNSNQLQCSCLENPRDGGPGGLLSMGPHRVGHYWSDLAAAAACFYISFLTFVLFSSYILFLSFINPTIHCGYSCFKSQISFREIKRWVFFSFAYILFLTLFLWCKFRCLSGIIFLLVKQLPLIFLVVFAGDKFSFHLEMSLYHV